MFHNETKIKWAYRFQVDGSYSLEHEISISCTEGDMQVRCRSLLMQICDAEDIRILKGVVFKGHIHIEYRPSQSVSYMVKKLKGRSPRKLQQEFPSLKQKYWGRHFWSIGYGCWSKGNITDEMVNEYLEHHRRPDDGQSNNFIIER